MFFLWETKYTSDKIYINNIYKQSKRRYIEKSNIVVLNSLPSYIAIYGKHKTYVSYTHKYMLFNYGQKTYGTDNHEEEGIYFSSVWSMLGIVAATTGYVGL